jgi:hypothetical protein
MPTKKVAGFSEKISVRLKFFQFWGEMGIEELAEFRDRGKVVIDKYCLRKEC